MSAKRKRAGNGETKAGNTHSKPGARKKAGPSGELKNRITSLEKELQSTREELLARTAACEELRRARDNMAARDAERTEELRQREERLSSAQRIARMGIWSYDLNQDREYWSDELYQMLGMTHDHPYMPIADLLSHIHPDDVARFKEGYEKVQRDWQSYGLDLRFIRPDGTVMHLYCQTNVECNSTGRPVQLYGFVQDITERKQAEEALRKSEEKFWLLAETSQAAIIIYQGDRFVYVNPTARAITRYSHDELMEKSLLDIVHPDYREHIGGMIALRKQGAPYRSRYEAKILARDGQERWLDCSTTQITYEYRPAGLVVALDITERKRAEEALRESEARYQAIVDSQTDMITRFTPDYRLTFVNESILRFSGLKREDFIGHSVLEFFSPDQHGKFMDCAAALDEGNATMAIENYVVMPSGEVRWLHWVNMAILDDNGRIIEVQSVGRDITERKRAEDDVARLSRLYAMLSRVNETIVRAHDIGSLFSEVCRIVAEEGGFPLAWIGQVSGRQVVPIAAGGPAAGYVGEIRVETEGELGSGPTGTSIRENRAVVINDFATNPRTASWHKPAMRYGFRGAAGFPLRRQGKAFGAITIYALKPDAFDPDQVRLLESLCADISYAIDALDDEQLRIQTEQKLKSEKEQAELYLDLMGHDISNMHQIMLMQLEMAKEIMETEGRIDRSFQEVITAPLATLHRSVSLIQNVRKLQQVRSGDFVLEPVDVGQVLEDVILMYAAVPGRNVTINYAPGNGCVVLANPLVRDVFSNLVDNAIKHSRDPVVIDISAGYCEDRGKRYGRIAIEDNGFGIPDDKKNVIFHRLKRGQTTARGTGLGLYIVKTIVEGLGGTVKVEDRDRGDHTRGARFVVCLPVQESDHAR